MKKLLRFLVLILLYIPLPGLAKTTNWTGYGSGILGGTDVNNWFAGYNWDNGIPAAGDNVQIGVTGFYYNPPILTASTSITNLTFGVAYNSVALTVNSGVVLTVTNNITAKYGSSGSTTISISGNGAISCGGSLFIGDNTAPAAPLLAGLFNTTNTVTVNLSIQTFTVTGSLTLNTTSSSAIIALLGSSNSSNVNNPTLNINGGTLSVSQNVSETNSNYVSTAITGYPTATNQAKLLVNPSTNAAAGSTPTFGFGGTLTIGTNGLVDFYGTGAGTSTVNYIGTSAQPVYTALTGLDTSPNTYQNIGFSGDGIKTIQAGTIDLSGNWSSAGGKIDAITNSSIISFKGAAQTLTDGGSNSNNGFSFGNVFFQGTGTKTISSGKFSIANVGILTMAGTATLSVGAGGTLTLVSDTVSTATVAAIPTGTAITGNVNVQRMIKGSTTDLSKRGYRFITSAVYTATVGGYKCFDLKYILDSAYVSGMSGGGFNAPSTNPSLYLYREDLINNTGGFTSGVYKGIAKINNTNAYDIGTQKRTTTANIADTTINLPVGNGVLFFFRGNLSNNSTQTGSKVMSPYDFPEDVPFTQVGQLNTGTITVHPWFEFDGTANTGNYLSYTNTPSLDNSLTQGFALVGNPYAATINWEKFNRQGVNSSIYGGDASATTTVLTKIWVYNPTTKQYDTYMQTPTVASAADTTTTLNPSSLRTGNASNMIASGQGFLIRATAKNQTLTFRESAKTSTQPLAADLKKTMSAPQWAQTLTFSSAAVQGNLSKNALSTLSFRLIKDNINTDDVVLALNNHTPNTFTPADDAEDLNGNGALVSLSIISSDNVASAIKQVQLPKKDKQVIKLLANATTSGRYQLKLNRIENLPFMFNVWLKDAFTNDSLDIKNNNTYTFNIDKSNAATFGANRFTIIVGRDKALAMHPLGLKAKKDTQGAKLIWQTENEGADYIFIVERSTDNGKTFKELNQVQSNASGTYSFLDTQPVLGDNLYKISIVNIADTKTDHAMTARLNYANTDNMATVTSNVSVYPNPAVSTVNIKITDNQNSTDKFSIKISNSTGMVVKEITSSLPSLQENISGLLPGTYLVKVVNQTANKLHGETKFVKLD